MTSVAATLTGPGGNTISGVRSDDVVGFGDLAPIASLTWSRDAHNLMAYVTGNIPVGAYSTTRLSALGIGYWAIDAGAGYTYLNEETGFEWSAVLGFTYNFINPHTQYQSGIAAHLDWAISPYVSDKMHLGAVGYFYNQLTGDSGPGALLGDFKSRVAGIGPQIGFFFSVGDREAYLNFKAYQEFNAKNWLHGWSAWVTLSFEPPERDVDQMETESDRRLHYVRSSRLKTRRNIILPALSQRRQGKHPRQPSKDPSPTDAPHCGVRTRSHIRTASSRQRHSRPATPLGRHS